MAADPLKPLIKGMFAMVLVVAAVLYVRQMQLELEEQLATQRAANRRIDEERRRRETADEQARLEAVQAASKVAEARARERAALEAVEAKKRPLDVGQAFGELRRKAEAGEADAQALMGYVCLRGMDEVLRVDPRTFGVSCSAPHASALIGQDIGPRLFDTRFVGIPRLAAVRADGLAWYRRAARQGHADAQASLAVAFAYGPDGGDALTEGFQWCLLAEQAAGETGRPSRDGNNAISLRRCHEAFDRRLSAEQKAAARASVAAFRPSPEKTSR